MDVERFGRDVKTRVAPGMDAVEGPKLSLHSEAQAVVQAAIAIATERRSEVVHGLHLLYALLRSPESGAADLLTRYGGEPASVVAELEKAIRST